MFEQTPKHYVLILQVQSSLCDMDMLKYCVVHHPTCFFFPVSKFFTERCHSFFKLGFLSLRSLLLRPALRASSSMLVPPRVCSSTAGSTLSDETSSIPPLSRVCSKRVKPLSSWLQPEALISSSLTYTIKVLFFDTGVCSTNLQSQ